MYEPVSVKKKKFKKLLKSKTTAKADLCKCRLTKFEKWG